MGMGPSGFEPESPAPQAGRISCGPDDARSPRPNQATPRTRGATRRSAAVKTFLESRPQSVAQPKGRTSSINSAWDRIIRRQQYRFRPRASSTPRVLPLAGAFDEGGERTADDLAAREAS